MSREGITPYQYVKARYRLNYETARGKERESARAREDESKNKAFYSSFFDRN